MEFNNANQAFKTYYNYIHEYGITFQNTKAILNCGFEILNPLDNHITESYRKWKLDYAEYEWQWYLSGNRSVSEIKKRAKIWDKMHSGDDIVNSNYGYQWSRNNQLERVLDTLKRDINTRRAVISIYDGKEISKYDYDTPCTLSIHFQYFNFKLNMTVNMRSCDIWYGFCNDQFCFSKLQEKVCNELNLEIGSYYHFCSNLHLYNNFLNKHNETV